MSHRRPEQVPPGLDNLLRSALFRAVDSVEPAADGLDRIRAKIAAGRHAPLAGLAAGRGRLPRVALAPARPGRAVAAPGRARGGHPIPPRARTIRLAGLAPAGRRARDRPVRGRLRVLGDRRPAVGHRHHRGIRGRCHTGGGGTGGGGAGALLVLWAGRRDHRVQQRSWRPGGRARRAHPRPAARRRRRDRQDRVPRPRPARRARLRPAAQVRLAEQLAEPVTIAERLAEHLAVADGFAVHGRDDPEPRVEPDRAGRTGVAAQRAPPGRAQAKGSKPAASHAGGSAQTSPAPPRTRPSSQPCRLTSPAD